jgi:hypothetical protein
MGSNDYLTRQMEQHEKKAWRLGAYLERAVRPEHAE